MKDAPLGRHRLLVIALVAVVLVCAWYPPLQHLANAQVDAGLKRALISFASARTLNAVISVVQGTEVAIAPLGLGVTLTLGQILDPINDLVEAFSSLMLWASVAFGVQKLLLDIGAHWAISLLVSVVAVAWGVLTLRGAAPRWLTRVALVMLLIRFAVPVVTLGSDLAFQQLMAADYAQGQAALDVAAAKVEAAAPDDEAGVLAKIEKRLPDLGAIKRSVEDVPERVVTLIVVFLMQTTIVPIVLLWALYRIAVSLVRSERRNPAY